MTQTDAAKDYQVRLFLAHWQNMDGDRPRINLPYLKESGLSYEVVIY